MIFQNTINEGIFIINVKLKRATMNEAGEFKAFLKNTVTGNNKQIIIDMSECEYIDSTFVGVLVSALRNSTETGGDIRLVGFKSSARTVIDITGTSRIFKIYPTVKQALSSFKSAA